ncbi:MAG: ankyrin repeat domain-containing protein [Alphaproteobacteria bacterium]|nr:ankyrin repeat domain-containing protein [Alphaproteobacteria bacterium]
MPQSAFAEEGDPPLFAAIEAKDTNKMNELIKSGEDVNAKDNDGQTALMSASRTPMVINILRRAGIDVNAENNDGSTLMTRVAARQAEVIKLLLAAKADVNAKNKYGYTALQIAKDSDFLGSAQQLLQEAGGR